MIYNTNSDNYCIQQSNTTPLSQYSLFQLCPAHDKLNSIEQFSGSIAFDHVKNPYCGSLHTTSEGHHFCMSYFWLTLFNVLPSSSIYIVENLMALPFFS